MRFTSTPRLNPVRGRTSRIMFCALGLFTTLGQASPPASIAPYFAPPPAHSGQFGDYRSPLQFDDGTRVEQASDWPRRRAEIHREWMQRLGPWPELIEHPQVQFQEVIRDEAAGYQRRRIRFAFAPDVPGEGWLLVPNSLAPEERRPAVLVVYYEPETSVGLNPKTTHRDFALQLVRRGFVTLSVGTPGGNAYQPQLGSATCQPLSFHAYVAANCWFVLASLPEVDPQRIGIVGHSYGGKWALFAGALWDRFAAVAVSDPGIMFDEQRPSVNYWEPWYLGADSTRPRRAAGVPSADNPRSGAYRDLVAAGRDLHELHALLAPRPLWVSGGSEDPPHRWQALNHLVQVNETLGIRHRVAMSNRHDHDPNDSSNALVMTFFQHFLAAPERPSD